MKRRTNVSYPRIIILTFISIILVGSVLLSLPVSSKSGDGFPFLNALFTATSATCITGLTVYDIYVHFSLFGQIVILLLIQIGGLGVMSMVWLFFFMLRRKISFANRMLMADSLSIDTNKGIVRMMRRMLAITFGCELLGAMVLSIRFVPLFGASQGIWQSVFLSVAAFCNAGFDIMGIVSPMYSLGLYVEDVLVNITIMSLIVLGGLGFFVWSDLIDFRKGKRLHLHTKIVLVSTAVLIISGTVIFYLLEADRYSFSGLSTGGKIMASFFQSVTARTAGFCTIPTSNLSDASKLVTIVLMFIGGSPGSTAGGVKTVTVFLPVLMTVSVIKGRKSVHLFGRKIDSKNISQANAILMISLLAVLLVLVLMCTTQSLPFFDLLFETVSAFGTAGMSTGITSELNAIGKVLMIIMMFFGRIGVLSIAIALTAKRKDANIEYPEEKVMVG